MMRERSQAIAGGWAEVYGYFAAVCDTLTHSPAGAETGPRAGIAPGTAAAVFRLLSGRDFTYLARKRCEHYRPAIEGHLQRAIERGEPASFYYDIGGGYRASLQPGTLPLSFAPGLGDLLMLHQIGTFLERAQAQFPVPIRFRLVVDNLCAYYVNGIPLESTHGYCSALRDILRHFRFSAVDLLVESEQIPHADYAREFEAALSKAPAPDAITPSAHHNVERFVGRRTDAERARHQLARYAAGSAATEACLARVVAGVRMTQRATPETMAFRSFPGSDVRIQCGEVGLGVGANGRVRPLLLTSANYERYRKERIDIADWGIPHVDAIRCLY